MSFLYSFANAISSPAPFNSFICFFGLLCCCWFFFLFKESMQAKAFPMNKIRPLTRCIPSSYWTLSGKWSSLHPLGSPGSAFWPLTFVCSVAMHFFFKKANSSKAAWEESLFYGGFSLLPERLGEGRSINSWKKTGRESRVFSLCPLEMRCACNRERNVLLAGPQQKGWWGSETKICTAFGITGTDAPDRSLGWLGEGKHTLPNSSERSKWKQLNTQKTHWKAWEDAPAASSVFVL